MSTWLWAFQFLWSPHNQQVLGGKTLFVTNSKICSLNNYGSAAKDNTEDAFQAQRRIPLFSPYTSYTDLSWYNVYGLYNVSPHRRLMIVKEQKYRSLYQLFLILPYTTSKPLVYGLYKVRILIQDTLYKGHYTEAANQEKKGPLYKLYTTLIPTLILIV